MAVRNSHMAGNRKSWRQGITAWWRKEGAATWWQVVAICEHQLAWFALAGERSTTSADQQQPTMPASQNLNGYSVM